MISCCGFRSKGALVCLQPFYFVPATSPKRSWQSQEVAQGMQEAASHACGHEVQVKGELIWCDAAEDAGAPIWAE